MAYKIGIMMIGSLYWENSDVRVNWRKSRLADESDEQFDVFAPIRYGRRSETRGNTYTMVFSKLCIRKSYGLGLAKVVTYKNRPNKIDDIIDEARLLWAAESNKRQASDRFWASWGSIGLLCNPSTKWPSNYFSEWTRIISNSNSYGNISHAKSEKPVLSKDGFLKLRWPIIVNQSKPLDHDIILATAADPTLDHNSGAYPTAKVIAEAWKRDATNVNYFRENRKHGIHTFQDKTISKMLK